MTKNRYAELGVSSTKEDVHNATENLDKGLYPGAFCKVLPDYICGDDDYCIIMHADGTGTKSSLAYAYWKEKGDLTVMRNIPQDAIVMNLDDVLCVGATGPFVVDQTINRNKFNLPAEPLAEIIRGTDEFLTRLRSFGVPIYFAGGETADVGDVVQTFIIDSSIFVRMKKCDVINCANIGPGDIIVGLSSYGPPASYETDYNSGIGSNGLTAVRHDLFSKHYAHKYPELWDHKNLTIDQVFTGKWKFDDLIMPLDTTPGELALSPTRTYAPIVLDFLKKFDRSLITGMIHCSGGGQTKCLNFVNNVHIIKEKLFEMPTIFELIYHHTDGKISIEEMYKVFNMGHRFEVYCKDVKTAEQVIASARQFHVRAQIIGKCEPFEGKQLTIYHNGNLPIVYK